MPGKKAPGPCEDTPRWILYPNCGAEEGGDWSRFTRFPGVWNCLQLWRSLFPAESVGWIGPVPPPEAFWAPETGEPPARAAFQWIEEQLGPHAWWGDTHAQAAFQHASLPWTGPHPTRTERVHDKAFALETSRQLGFEPQPLRGLSETFSPEDLEDSDGFLHSIQRQLEDWPPGMDAFTLKPRLGSSGRGRIGGARSTLNRDALRGALPRLRERGGAVLEPWLSRRHDLAVALHLAPSSPGGSGAVTLLGSLEAIVHPSGLPLGHFGEMDSRGRVFSGSPFDEDIREAAVALAQAAQREGYDGPCGVDAFTFDMLEQDQARETLRPVVEFNARYTLGLVAVGVLRRLLTWIKSTLELSPGERVAFFVGLQTPAGLDSWTASLGELSPKIVGLSLAPAAPAEAFSGPGVLLCRDRATLAALVGAP